MRIEYGARIRARNALLFLPAVACFVEAARVPWNGDPGSILTGTMGFWLALWALAVDPHPIPVIVAGWALGAMTVGGDLGLIKDNVWSALAFVPAFACFLAWPKIQKIWKR